MSNAARSINVENSLYSRREALELEKAQLEQEHGDTALAITEGDTAALQRIPGIKQRQRDIQDELAAIDAASRALNRRDHESQLQDRVSAVKDAEARLPAAVEAVSDAWDNFAASIDAMEAAWRTVQLAAEETNALARTCQKAGSRAGHLEAPNALQTSTLQRLAGNLLWLATGDQIKPGHFTTGVTAITADKVRQNMDSHIESLQITVSRHTERALAVIQRDA